MDSQLQHHYLSNNSQSLQSQMLDVIPEESEFEDAPETSPTPEHQEREEHDAFTSDEDDDVRLKVLRPKRMSCSFSEEPSLHEMSNQDPESSKLDSPLGEGSTTRLNASLHSWERFPRPVKRKKRKTSLMKKRRRSRNSSLSSVQYTNEELPQWLVNLMINIEEAKTHQLVIE